HGSDGPIEVVGNLRRLVNDEESDAGEAPHCVFLAGQADDAAAVGKLDLGDRLRVLDHRNGPADGVVSVEDLAEEFVSLPLDAGEKKDQRFRREEGGMQCKSGDDRALAGLPGAVKDDLSLGRIQKLPL